MKMTRSSNSTFAKVVLALFLLIQVASAFVSSARSTLASTTSLSAKTSVTGIGGLNGVEIVGLDKKKAASASSTGKGKAKTVGKKTSGGFKFNANLFKK